MVRWDAMELRPHLRASGNPLPLHISTLFPQEVVAHAFTTREGGVSPPPFESLNLALELGDDPGAVFLNRERVAEVLGFSGSALATVRQVHGNRALRVGRGGISPHEASSAEADSLWTTEPGILLGIRVADCVPILLWEGEAGAVAAVHAGWRGTVEGAVTAALDLLVKEGGARPERIRAAVGPAIGACCYLVGREVIAALDRSQPEGAWEWRAGGDPSRDAPMKVDLRAANVSLLRERGVRREWIDVSTTCTRCDPRLFSYRRDGQRSGRSMGVIGLKMAREGSLKKE